MEKSDIRISDNRQNRIKFEMEDFSQTKLHFYLNRNEITHIHLFRLYDFQPNGVEIISTKKKCFHHRKSKKHKVIHLTENEVNFKINTIQFYS